MHFHAKGLCLKHYRYILCEILVVHEKKIHVLYFEMAEKYDLH